jgi:hypothetical protein
MPPRRIAHSVNHSLCCFTPAHVQVMSPRAGRSKGRVSRFCFAGLSKTRSCKKLPFASLRPLANFHDAFHTVLIFEHHLNKESVDNKGCLKPSLHRTIGFLMAPTVVTANSFLRSAGAHPMSLVIILTLLRTRWWSALSQCHTPRHRHARP